MPLGLAVLLVLSAALVVFLRSSSDVPDRDFGLSSVFDSRFTPPHSDYANDTNGDGAYDFLVIRAHVNIVTDGGYDFGIILFTGTNTSGTYVGGANASFELSPGLQYVDLPFDGGLISASRFDGNFTARLYMLNQSVEIDQDVYVTSFYYAADFVLGAARFEGSHSEYLLDTNNDSRYEFLVVNVTVNVTSPGDYYIDAMLTDASNHYITGLNCDVTNTTGIQEVQLNFSGVSIYGSATDGPYLVELGLYIPSPYNRIDWSAFLTGAYTYLQFEPGFGIAEPISDYGLDTDGDGLFNYLGVQVTVNLPSAGTCDLLANLRPNPPNDIIASDENYTVMDAGLHVIALVFDGKLISGYGSDGPYLVQLMLWTNTTYYNYYYTTNPYLASQFERTAYLEPPPSSWSVDTNSDGLFDGLVVQVAVRVEDAGQYTLMGKLYNDSTMYVEIDEAGNSSHLSVGNWTLDIQFAGWNVSASRSDGTCWYAIYLYAESGALIDSLVGNTSPILRSEFAPAPAPLMAPWLETFENGSFGSGGTANWRSTIPQSVEITSQTSESGNMSLAICGTEPRVMVFSPVLNVSAYSSVEIRYWLRIGCSPFSDNPDWADELYVWLWNSTSWCFVDHYFNSPSPGSIHVTLFSISVDAAHPFVQLLFVAIHGGGPGTDYWHVDDIYIGPSSDPIAAFLVNTALGDPSTMYQFDASSSWDVESPTSELQFRWDWDGDGTWDTGWTSDPTAQHQFAVSGTYDVRLEVMDPDGNTNVTQFEVTVLDLIPEFPSIFVPAVSIALVLAVVAGSRHRLKLA
jgi:hypothetical protein